MLFNLFARLHIIRRWPQITQSQTFKWYGTYSIFVVIQTKSTPFNLIICQTIWIFVDMVVDAPNWHRTFSFVFKLKRNLFIGNLSDYSRNNNNTNILITSNGHCDFSVYVFVLSSILLVFNWKILKYLPIGLCVPLLLLLRQYIQRCLSRERSVLVCFQINRCFYSICMFYFCLNFPFEFDELFRWPM